MADENIQLHLSETAIKKFFLDQNQESTQTERNSWHCKRLKGLFLELDWTFDDINIYIYI
jgi:hypothetical protein